MSLMLCRIALFVALAAASSCATFVTYGRCLSEKINIDAATAVNDVRAAFYAFDYISALVPLVSKYGRPAVECAIDQFIMNEGKKLTLTPAESTALDRARAYRATHP